MLSPIDQDLSLFYYDSRWKPEPADAGSVRSGRLFHMGGIPRIEFSGFSVIACGWTSWIVSSVFC